MATRPGLYQRGFSLVEMMVALVIGLGVVAALMTTYLAVFKSNRQSKAMSQVTEDATIAMNMLRAQLTQAGYSRPVGVAGSGFSRAWPGAANAAISGCDGNFVNMSTSLDQLDCVSVTTGQTVPDSLAVAFEAIAGNRSNTLTTAAGLPLDCLGNTYAAVAGPPAYYLSYSRFYLAVPTGLTRRALHCLGPGNAAGQALVENIEDMQILYGLSPNPNNTTSDNSTVANHYEDASQLAAGVATDIAGRMTNVVSIRICLLVSSADEVLDEPVAYRNCQQASVTPSDRRIYRAFYSTFLLNNRLGAL